MDISIKRLFVDISTNMSPRAWRLFRLSFADHLLSFLQFLRSEGTRFIRRQIVDGAIVCVSAVAIGSHGLIMAGLGHEGPFETQDLMN